MLSLKASASFDQDTIIFLDQESINQKKFNFKNIDIQDKIINLQKLNVFSGEKGQIIPIFENNRTLLLIGLGVNKEIALAELRVTISSILSSSYLKKSTAIDIVPHTKSDDVIKALIQSISLSSYKWNKYKSKNEDDKTVNEKDIYLITATKKSFEDMLVICKGTNFARDLVNDNADIITSTYFEKNNKESN